jgi:hypothetical protein
MTHEPIRVIHFSPHITWQGTQACRGLANELDAMLSLKRAGHTGQRKRNHRSV